MRIAGLAERGALTGFQGGQVLAPEPERCLCALIVAVAFDFGAVCRQMKLGFDARDHCRCQELAIGINDEQIARPVEEDASARPVFVFVKPNHSAQGRINRPARSSAVMPSMPKSSSRMASAFPTRVLFAVPVSCAASEAVFIPSSRQIA
jgi:hypothetical protein